MKKRLFTSSSVDDLIELLQAWRFWLLSALVGALIGGVIYFIFPPDFRARATVVVDFNIEQAWPVNSDRELFYYLEREARKLEEVAKSDETLSMVANKVGNVRTICHQHVPGNLHQPGRKHLSRKHKRESKQPLHWMQPARRWMQTQQTPNFFHMSLIWNPGLLALHLSCRFPPHRLAT